jgi:hypothetical protein
MNAEAVTAMPDGPPKLKAYMALSPDEQKRCDELMFTPTERVVMSVTNANFAELTTKAERCNEDFMREIDKSETLPLVLHHILRLHATLVLRAELTKLGEQTLDKTLCSGRFEMFSQKTRDMYKQKIAAEVFGNAN